MLAPPGHGGCAGRRLRRRAAATTGVSASLAGWVGHEPDAMGPEAGNRGLLRLVLAAWILVGSGVRRRSTGRPRGCMRWAVNVGNAATRESIGRGAQHQAIGVRESWRDDASAGMPILGLPWGHHGPLGGSRAYGPTGTPVDGSGRGAVQLVESGGDDLRELGREVGVVVASPRVPTGLPLCGVHV